MRNKKALKKGGAMGKNLPWKKGHSSSHNPKCTKFRDEARTRGFRQTKGGSKLTESALTLHNIKNTPMVSENAEFDEETIGGKSFMTAFSNCTNPAFTRLLSYCQTDCLMHREMLAVLAAVSDVIKAKGGTETDTEYFAALMTALEIADTDEARVAVTSLLYMIMKKLPTTVLKHNLVQSCATFEGLLMNYIDSDFHVLPRNLLGCLFHFLKAVDVSQWSDVLSRIYGLFLDCTIHQKPRIRKAAQEAVISLLKNFDCLSGHPAQAAAKFCIAKLESSLGFQQTRSTYHLLNLLGQVLHFFNKSDLKLCCETILRAMTLSDSMMVSACFKSLQNMFSNKPDSKNLPALLNVQLIKALHEFQPGKNSFMPLIDWLSLMESAFCNLLGRDFVLGMDHLPNFFRVAVSCWLCEKDDVHSAVASALKTILLFIGLPSSSFHQHSNDKTVIEAVPKIFHTVEEALSFQYHKAWKYILEVLSALFDVFGPNFSDVMTDCLQSLSDLHRRVAFPYITEVNNAIGVAISKMGPDVVLKALPLNLFQNTERINLQRAWLLPLLTDKIKNTQLAFFMSYFLPLTSQLKQRERQYTASNQLGLAKTCEVLCSQVWSVLTGFCTSPTDLQLSFRSIAKTLGMLLTDEPSLRCTVLRALRNIIASCLQNEEDKLEVATFAKNYLPILFNIYTTKCDDKSSEYARLATYDTIKAYLQISDKELCFGMFQRCFEKFDDTDSFKQCALIDLTRALMQYLDTNCIEKIFFYCKPLLQCKNHTVQKKSYSVISELCASDQQVCRDFVDTNIDNLKEILITSLSSSAPSSKFLRLRCVQHIVKHLPEAGKDFLLAVIPEAVLCTKETATKARKAAFELLTEIGETFKKWGKQQTGIRGFLQILLAGFEGSPHMISATILAIGHIIYTYKDDLDSSLIDLLIDNICLLLSSMSREVVTSALSFVKVLFSCVTTEDLSCHVEKIIACVANICEDNQRHFRFKAKELFTRLIRKFGYPMIAKLAPEKFQKQLSSIRKLEARKKKKSSGEMTLDSDVESNEESNIMDILNIGGNNDRSKRRTRGKMMSCIEESTENDIVDFMDPKVSQKVLTRKRGANKKHDNSPPSFGVSEDGRLIITEEDSPTQRKRKRSAGDDVSLTEEKSSAERKKQKVELDSDEEHPKKSMFVAKGIHRNLKRLEPAPGATFKAKKALGDVKKGKLDPHAYIPLDRQVLNKRRKKKLGVRYNSVKPSKRAVKVLKRTSKKKRN